jgi:hypothetical protein
MVTESKRPLDLPETPSSQASPLEPVQTHRSSLAADVPPSALPAPPADELASSIQASITEIAVMWLLHWSRTRPAAAEPLDQRITNFSPVVFDAITARFSALRPAKPEHLWMIYFKGLLAAGTHSRDDMIAAIKAVDTRDGIRTSAPLSVVPDASSDTPCTEHPSPGSDPDSEVLEQIGKALRLE